MDEKRRKLVTQSVLFPVVSSVYIFFLFKFLYQSYYTIPIDYLFLVAFFSIGVIDPLYCLVGGANLKLKTALLGFYYATGSLLLMLHSRNVPKIWVILSGRDPHQLGIFLGICFGIFFGITLVAWSFNEHKNKTQEQHDLSTSTDMGWLWYIWSITEVIILVLCILCYFFLSHVHIGIL